MEASIQLGSAVNGYLLSTDPHSSLIQWAVPAEHTSLTTYGQGGLETRALHVWEPGEVWGQSGKAVLADALRLDGTARFQGGAGKLRGLQRWEEESWRPVSALGLCVILR